MFKLFDKKVLPSSFAIFHNISTTKLVKFIWSSLLFFITSWIEIRFTLPLVPVPFQFNYWCQVNWQKLYHYFVFFQMIECWFSLIIFACLLETKREMVKVWTIEGDYHVKPDRSKGNFYIFSYHCSLMSLSKIFRFEFEIFLCQCFSPLRILIILNTMRFDSDSLKTEVSGQQVVNDNWLAHISNSIFLEFIKLRHMKRNEQMSQ